MNKMSMKGLVAAIFSITVWGSTYISTKVLVEHYSALQISLIRFTIGVIVLMILSPPGFHRIKKTDWKNEGWIAATGIVGIFLYYFLENQATHFTYASNVSVIVTSVPLITSLIGPFFFRDEHFRLKYIIAFILTIAGFLLILSQSGKIEGVSVKGDILALLAAFVFAAYTLLLRKAGEGNNSPLIITRRAISYGWLVIFIMVVITGDLKGVLSTEIFLYWPHFLFLGILASGFCFLSWAYAVKQLGAVVTSQCIYLVPAVTVSLSVLLLGERFSVYHLLGMAGILAAVVISQFNFNRRKIHMVA